MAAMSDYLEGELVKHLFRTGSFTKPAALYIGLYTVAPTDSGGGTEVSGGSYARAQLDPSDANWAAPSAGDGKTSNAAIITFPAPTANWSTVVAFGIFDAASAGNLLLYGTINPTKEVLSGDPQPKFAVGALQITFA
jgi:hypothetical protein